MTLQPPEGRGDYLFDLSRWNRAGLTRFDYVDGDATVWLEELRIALLGFYLRGIEPDDRVPEKWRDLFLKSKVDRQLPDTPAAFEEALVWKELFTPFPIEVETGGERNQRLLAQYNRHTPDYDYAWEIMRAFARAAHIVLGHQNAYANEGYLRTATQWENLRKLAAMVNYQPTPPAAATALVALIIEEDKGVIEIARGLAMKYAPPEGGAPLIFETLKPILAHPELNAAHTESWDCNLDILEFGAATHWIVPEKADLVQGDLVVVSGEAGAAASLSKIKRNLEAGLADLTFDPPPSGKGWETGKVLLLTEPDSVQLGLPKTIGTQLVIQIAGAASFFAGTIVQIAYAGAEKQTHLAVVLESSGNFLTLKTPDAAPDSPAGAVTVEALTPFAVGASGEIETQPDIFGLYYINTSGSGTPAAYLGRSHIRYEIKNDDASEPIASVHKISPDTSGPGYARIADAKRRAGVVVGEPVGSASSDGKTVRFSGKPPKSLHQGGWYVARKVGDVNLTPLMVSSIRIEADFYSVSFSGDPPGNHDKTEFFGPMTRTLRPVDHVRDQRDAVIAGVSSLEKLSPEAQSLVKVGREIILVDEENEPSRAAQARLTSVEPGDDILKITMESDEDFSGWRAGWTRFYLNTANISHGETKDPKILGSGDAEKRRQNFPFKITSVSFIPSNASVSGVAPDMDVTVDGVKWEFRDIGDPEAEGDDAWSVALNEDDTLQIHFRRRLPTGSNNVAVSRHRVGVGARGTGVPPWSFTKPMKKNRFVVGIVQPFTSAGGADREPVSDIRQNAPSKLAANGRAVSLRDFDRLCQRHASVWQAKAREVIGTAAGNQVNIVVVPANGGVVNPTLEEDLIDFIESRAAPNVAVSITGYLSLALRIHVKIYVDIGRYEKTDVKDGAEAALVAEFALKNRNLGQPLYVAEILAALERVEGVSSATITLFDLKPGAPEPLRKATISGGLVAIFPTEIQVVVLEGVADVTVAVEAQV